MGTITIGVDLAKQVFAVCSLDPAGRVRERRELSRSAFVGKPYTISEVNHPNPNEYASETIPILAAYGAFQDWDGIFVYTFEPKALDDWQPYVVDNFDITLDPVKMIQMSVGALLMSLSTIIVALNAQLLRRLDLRPETAVRDVLGEVAAADFDVDRRAVLHP